MSVPPVLEHAHDGPWVWDDLPDREELRGWRAEIVDGSLVLSPPPRFEHDLSSFELAVLLREACPPDLVAVAPGQVEFGRTYRQPDAMVARRSDQRHRRPLPAEQVVLVVECQSASSVTTDRITKAHEYASIGIEHYWRLETEPEPLLQAFRLVDGTYAEVATLRGSDVHTFTAPFAVTVDLSRLFS